VRALLRLPPSRLRRSVTSVACALAIIGLTTGCGFLNALSDPAPPSEVPAPVSAEASAAPAPDNSAEAELTGSADGRPASLAVSVAAVETGVPPGLWPGDCELVDDATEYATVSVVFTDRSPPTKQIGVSSNLRLDVTVEGGSGIGLLVRFHTASNNCVDTAVLPQQATLQSENLAEQHQTMTLYVVARTTPADSDPLHGITVQLRDPRHHPDTIDSGTWTWDVQRVTAGSTCPDDPDSLCVPLN
jgi:hypothetical protein